jgi:hypothetical protein
MAHPRPGLHRVYDKFSYLDEKRELFRLWELRLASIVNPKPDPAVADLSVAPREQLPARVMMG